MKTVLASLGMYFLGMIICTVLSIIFIEGWGIIIAIVSFVVIYFVTTLLICKFFPKLWWIAAIIITSYAWMWEFGIGLSNIIELLVEPSLIDGKNFYNLLPLISFVSSFAGSYVGYKLSMKEEMHLKSNTNSKKTG